ncbi:MAG: lipid-A-disaccharide synthase [Candidatus Omnitrophota bacterium]
MKKIFIVAGETSGDHHAALLVQELKYKLRDAEFFGLGGKNLENVGVKLLFNITDLAVVGFFEVLANFSKFKKIFKETLVEIERIKPDCCILVDYPGFNLRLARELKKRGIHVIYYISPQVWAWGKSRVKIIKDCVDKMIVFFDFEKEFYKNFDIEAESVGHPLLDAVNVDLGQELFLKKVNFNKDKSTIALMPGSRKKEVYTLLPIMLDAAKIIAKKSRQKAQFILIEANTIKSDLNVTQILNQNKELELVTITEEERYDGLFASDIAIIVSGTATLEAMLLDTPMVVIYKLNLLSWFFARFLIKIPYIGLVNVVAGEKIVPELIQFKAKPRPIAKTCLDMLSNREKYKSIVLKLDEAKKRLGSPGATERAAKIIADFINVHS